MKIIVTGTAIGFYPGDTLQIDDVIYVVRDVRTVQQSGSIPETTLTVDRLPVLEPVA